MRGLAFSALVLPLYVSNALRKSDKRYAQANEEGPTAQLYFHRRRGRKGAASVVDIAESPEEPEFIFHRRRATAAAAAPEEPEFYFHRRRAIAAVEAPEEPEFYFHRRRVTAAAEGPAAEFYFHRRRGAAAAEALVGEEEEDDGFGCLLGQEVFVTSPSGTHLENRMPLIVGMTATEGDFQKWVMSDAGDGKVFLTASRRNVQLEDRFGIVFVGWDKKRYQKWTLSRAGNNTVFITSHRGKQLYDRNGSIKFSSEKGEAQQWTVTTSRGANACGPRQPTPVPTPPPPPAPTPVPMPPKLTPAPSLTPAPGKGKGGKGGKGKGSLAMPYVLSTAPPVGLKPLGPLGDS